MGKIIKTTEDGWDCVPELMEVVRCLGEIGHDIYEIKNCVRRNDLEGMVENMKDYLQQAIDILEDIDTEREFITIE